MMDYEYAKLLLDIVKHSSSFNIGEINNAKKELKMMLPNVFK